MASTRKHLSQAEKDALKKERDNRKALRDADKARSAAIRKDLKGAKAELRKAKTALRILERKKVIAAQIPQLEFDLRTARIAIKAAEDEIAALEYRLERTDLTFEALQELREEVGIPASMATAQERNIVEAVTNYRELLIDGKLTRPVTGTTDFDLDASPRGAIAATHTDTKGMILTRENVQELIFQARKAIDIATGWNLPVYAVVHMYQTEPTYGEKGAGKVGGKPDGWIWQNPKDRKQVLFSTWQGIKQAQDAQTLADRLEDHLYEMAKANGDKVVAIVHDIEIRSVLPGEMKEPKTKSSSDNVKELLEELLVVGKYDKKDDE